MEKRYEITRGIMLCRHNPKGWGDINVCDNCSASLINFDKTRIPMGFNFSDIEVLWIDKQNNFKASLQKKNSQADTNDVDYHNALKQFIVSGKIFLTPGLKIIYV